MSDQGIVMGGRRWGERRWGRWWVWLQSGSAQKWEEGRCWGEDQTKRGIVVFFLLAVSHYSIKTQAATGALTEASIMTSTPLNSRPSAVFIEFWFLFTACPIWASVCATVSLSWHTTTGASVLRSYGGKKSSSYAVLQEGKWCVKHWQMYPSMHPSSRTAGLCWVNIEPWQSQDSTPQEAQRHKSKVWQHEGLVSQKCCVMRIVYFVAKSVTDRFTVYSKWHVMGSVVLTTS